MRSTHTVTSLRRARTLRRCLRLQKRTNGRTKGHRRLASTCPSGGRSCLLVCTNSPGILLVHLYQAGLGVAVVGQAQDGLLHVRTADRHLVRSAAAEAGAQLLEVRRVREA